jgi:CheY-like chemotaxis protein
VADNGPGIPPQYLKEVFDLFAQGEQDPSRSLGGLGLGLSLVQQLVKAQGGEVSAFSKGVAGEGAEFVLRLPTIPAPVERAETTGTDGQRVRRVLVVDDNRDAAETMSMLLEALGYHATVVHDGIAALEAIKTDAAAVVLLDIGLPGLSGLEVAKKVASEVANPPALIAVTGYGQEKDRELSFEAGFCAHLTKPVDVDKLTGLLERLFAER